MKLNLVISILLVHFFTAQAGQSMPLLLVSQGLILQSIQLGKQDVSVDNQQSEIKKRNIRALSLHIKTENRALKLGKNKFNYKQTRTRIQQPR